MARLLSRLDSESSAEAEGRLRTVGSPLTLLDPVAVASETPPRVEPRGEPTVSVVIPAFNEADNLRWVMERMPPMVSEIVLVDGGSNDGTPDVARELWPDATILTHPRRGKGNALATGFEAARGDIIVMLDADGSADPQEIPRFVQALKLGADFAKGTRFSAGGGSDDITHFRRFGNSGLVALVNLLYGTHFTDLCYGLNAFWRRCLPHVAPECDGFEVEAFMNLRMAKSDLRIEEVGSYELKRIFGVSKLHSVRDGLRIVRTIFTLWSGATKGSGPLVDALGAVASSDRPRVAWGSTPEAVLTVALVNNMPDSAFAVTDQQFSRLITSAAPEHRVRLRRYLLPGHPRGVDPAWLNHMGYQPLPALFDAGADALVVTGTEPRQPRLVQEQYWPDLEGLIHWGIGHTRSMVLSCLAAHAAVQILDGVERQPLSRKCLGVHDSRTSKGDPLVAGLPEIVAIPHSHWNEVHAADLIDRGYRPLLTSESDWTSMTKEVNHCLMVLFQGHPEYERMTLLREFRRDWRRYHEGSASHAPRAPRGYLTTGGWLEIQRLEGLANLGPNPALASQFPLEALAAHVRPSWSGFSAQLYANWLTLLSGAVPKVAEAVPVLRPVAARL